MLFQVPGRKAGGPKIAVQRRDIGGARRFRPHHIARAFHRIGGHGQPAGQRFQQHQPEGVGAAGKGKDIAGCIGLHQRLAAQGAEEFGVRIFPFQRAARRAVADNHLGAGKIERQEGLDILFHRHSPDVNPYRAVVSVAPIGDGTEALDIDAARPEAQVLESVARQVALQALGRHHHRRGRGVKPAQHAPDQCFGHERKARMDIFGEAGVEGCGEGDAMLDADPARR